MSQHDLDRRGFLGAAAVSLAALHGHSSLDDERPRRDHAPNPRTASSANVLTDIGQIDAGLLNVGYVDAGPANGPVVMLLHGWPYDVQSYADVVPLLTAKGYRVIVPYLRGYGSTHFRSADTMRDGQQAAFADDVVALMDALHIPRAVVAGFDWGSRTAAIVGALWPERCKALVCVSGYLVVNLAANQQPLPPRAELGWWYQYYFATERGRHGYDANRNEFNKLIWTSASPLWHFDDATYDRTAASFANPDHTDIVIHNYRWRLELAKGEARYDALEQRLAESPSIRVPSITIASDFDGAAADGAGYARRFTGPYAHRILKGIGHNVPQEAPEAFADAVVAADRL
ncbi:MAG TPA: alpha/beta hydrolase [Gemmatimonadaceae bacterium]|jgi:pimeloyl-ACP methyl ester carboxylesterase